MKTLLQKALQVKMKKQTGKIASVEEEELALAWLASSINFTQLAMALGLQKRGANAYSKICIFLRSAYQSNKLKIL